MSKSRTFRLIAAAALFGALAVASPQSAHALKGDCAQPFTNNAGGPLATDCLFILQAATGSRTCTTPCICDADGSGATVATDALLCLIESVSTAPLACNCPDLQAPAYAFVPGDCPIGSQQAGVVATNYVGAFPQDTPPTMGNWTAGWTLEVNGTVPNKTIWQPAAGGTLGGGTPSANGSCPAGTTDIGNTNLPAPFTGSMDVCRLAPRYDTDGQTITLTNDNVYRLGGAANQGTKFGNGDGAGKTPATAADVTLVVEPGTLILGEESEALAITRGSNVDINGTAVDPVVMTSVETFNAWLAGGNGNGSRGEWGGLVVTGFGRANQCNNPTTCDFQLEGFLSPFFSGGTDNTDDSGDIEYLVISQGGFDIDGNGNELNGLTLFNVGSGTNIHHVQVHENVDDGIEFFGGAVNVSYAVVTDVADDSIDADLGYQGAVQFALVRQSADANADRAFEMDSHPTPASDTLISQPCFVNITTLGESAASTEGANIGSGTRAYFSNGIFKGHNEKCIALENGTLALRGAGLQIHNYYADCATEFTGQAPDTAGTVATWYNADPNNRKRSTNGSVGVNSIGYPSQLTF